MRNPNRDSLSLQGMHASISAMLLVLAVLILAAPAMAAEPMLEITVGKQVQRLSLAELLANPALREVDVARDTAYGRPMRYRAVPLAALLARLSETNTVQFTATDGFVANIPGTVLAGGGQPWLAIEPPNAPWPALKPGGVSAGPFYLVWLAPEKHGIVPEQWPYQVAKITEVLPLQTRYPQILPKQAGSADSAEQRGLKVYVANCAVCHQLNGGGDATVGPDLNKPFSPTEYFQEPFLRKLIRDSASVRNWGQRAMPPFTPAALSDAKMDDLLAYLRQMAKER